MYWTFPIWIAVCRSMQVKQFVATLFSKRNTSLICSFFLVPLGQMMYALRSSGIQSSPKEMQLSKACISFGEECISKYIQCCPYEKKMKGNQNKHNVAIVHHRPTLREETSALSVVWCLVTSISTGRVHFLFLDDHWPCFLADELSCLFVRRTYPVNLMSNV